jgi:large subunit ribosomal protein L10
VSKVAQLLERASIKRKAQRVDDLSNLINEYNVVAFASLNKVRAAQLQELAKRFRSEIFMKVSKNILVKRALKQSNKPNIQDLTEHLKGSNTLLFTNMSPFTLSLTLEKNKIRTTAKAGDIAPEDIIISAGNTGLPPGPAISELNDAGIRTRIEAGSVWVIRETTVANKGEEIQPRIASVLSKLDIRPLEVGLRVVAAYEDGLVFSTDQLLPDIEALRIQFADAAIHAHNLAMASFYPTSQTIESLLQLAHLNARNLAVNATYPTSATITDILAKAYQHMQALTHELAKINKDAVPKDV